MRFLAVCVVLFQVLLYLTSCENNPSGPDVVYDTLFVEDARISHTNWILKTVDTLKTKGSSQTTVITTFTEKNAPYLLRFSDDSVVIYSQDVNVQETYEALCPFGVNKTQLFMQGEVLNYTLIVDSVLSITKSVSDEIQIIRNFYPYKKTAYPPSGWLTVRLDPSSDDKYERAYGLIDTTVLKNDSTVQEHSISSGDQDCFSLAVKKNLVYLVNASDPDSVGTHPQIKLYDSTGTQLGAGTKEGHGEKIEFGSVYTGKVYLTVVGFDRTAHGRYKIFAVVVDTLKNDSAEPNDTSSKAYTLTGTSDEFTGTLLNNDVDWFKFVVNEGKNISIIFDSPLALSASVYAKSNLNTPLSSFGNSTSLIYTVQDSGMYYLKVTSSSGTIGRYNLEFALFDSTSDRYEPDDTWQQATAIGTDDISQCHILARGEKDYYSFVANAGFTYVIQTRGEVDTKLTLYSTDGTSVLKTDDDGGSGRNALITFVPEKSGTYYFAVYGYDNSKYGIYTIAVTEE